MVNVRIVDHDQQNCWTFTTRRRTALVCTWTNHFNFINSGNIDEICFRKNKSFNIYISIYYSWTSSKKGRTNSGALRKTNICVRSQPQP